MLSFLWDRHAMGRRGERRVHQVVAIKEDARYFEKGVQAREMSHDGCSSVYDLPILRSIHMYEGSELHVVNEDLGGNVLLGRF